MRKITERILKRRTLADGPVDQFGAFGMMKREDIGDIAIA